MNDGAELPPPLHAVYKSLLAERYTHLPQSPTGLCDDGPTRLWQLQQAVLEANPVMLVEVA